MSRAYPAREPAVYVHFSKSLTARSFQDQVEELMTMFPYVWYNYLHGMYFTHDLLPVQFEVVLL